MTVAMLRALALIGLLASPALAETPAAKSEPYSRVTRGTVEVNTMIKKKSSDCPNSVTRNCKPGKPCFATIYVEGDSAKELWTMLHAHGTRTDEVEGDYVATKTEALTCSETDGKYYCAIGYDAVRNVLMTNIYCDPE